jgi:hypothetical protein
MSQIYLFSGLGADYRAFEKLDFSNYTINHIQWIKPERNESIEAYAKRISTQVKHENPVFIGLSFGGIMAIEVSKYIQTQKIILIASSKTKYEIPFYYRFVGKLNLHKLAPTKMLKKANVINYWAFGVKSKSDQLLLKNILNDTDNVFLKWALDAIVKWENKEKNKAIFHIHGTADRILPYRFVNNAIKIKEGGHFMTINKSQELSQEIHKILNLQSAI